MPQTCDTLLLAPLIVTQNDAREIISNGAIAIGGGKILGIGPRAETEAAFQAAERLEMADSLLMPGLVNAHTHASMTLLRGYADDLPLMEWLQEHIFPAEGHLAHRMVYVGAMLACAEMMRTGTTDFYDMYLLESAVLEAVDKAGMRAICGEVIFAFPSVAYKDVPSAFALYREQAQGLKGHDRLRLGVSPHAVYTTNREILEGCRDLAEELDLPLFIHLAETRQETEDCLAMHGVRPVELCRLAGILGPKTTIHHGIDLNWAEQDLLAQCNVKMSHNPKSNMKLASGVAPVPELLQKGVCVGLGTDGAASNNSLNMFAEMSVAALLHKVHTMDPTTLPAQTVLDMATRNGARALHQTDSGALETGAPADIIALDLQAPGLTPMHNPVSHLVYAASGHEVRLNMVAGRVLYKDGKYLTLNLADLRQEAQEIADHLRKLCTA